MIVRNILAGKHGDVVAIEPTADLTGAIKLLAERRIGAVVILGFIGFRVRLLGVKTRSTRSF